MRLASRRRYGQAGRSGDEGFTMVEVVMACTVLITLAAAVGALLINSLQVSKAGRQRVAAANLAARELEITRNLFGSSDSNALLVASSGTTYNPNPLTGTGPSVVDGTPYTVRRQVEWLPTGNGASACDGGSLVNYPSLRVSVAVSWPNMRFAKPVAAQTLLTPNKGTFDDVNTAYLAVKVQNAGGTGASGVEMTAAGPGGSFTQLTDASGCAVFQVGTAGTYTVALTTAGWVDQTGVAAPTKEFVVLDGQLARGSMTYDRAASLDITFAATDGYPLPSPLPAVNYVKPNVPSSEARQVVAATATTTRVSGLWPTSDGYSAWAGGCSDSDPAGSPTGGSRGAPVVVAPGGVGAVTAALAPVALTVATSAGVPVPGATVTATGVAPCLDSALTLGTTDATGRLQVSLPFGQWTLQTTYQGNAVTDSLAPVATGVTTDTFQVD